jgi:hypothetical protein
LCAVFFMTRLLYHSAVIQLYFIFEYWFLVSGILHGLRFSVLY